MYINLFRNVLYLKTVLMEIIVHVDIYNFFSLNTVLQYCHLRQKGSGRVKRGEEGARREGCVGYIVEVQSMMAIVLYGKNSEDRIRHRRLWEPIFS